MSVSLAHEPLGHRWSTTEVQVTIGNSGSVALVGVSSPHGLSAGNAIYIVSNVSAYQGEWIVRTVVSPTTFTFAEFASGAHGAEVPFQVAAFATYRVSVQSDRWAAVHLPIIYVFKSNLWPINSADTARTVTTFSNYNGYTYLNLSGDLKASGIAAALEEIVISGTAALDGVYKILTWISDTNIVIDLPYLGSHSFVGGTVQYYYLNYHIRVKVYAGSSYFTVDKPFTEIAELRVVPDSSGLVRVNVADILKKEIGILTNNPHHDHQPNNTDAFTEYYLSYAESYLDSDGYSTEEFVGSYTETTEAYAINAKPPFKTRYVGAMSEYIYGGVGYPQKFLTVWEEPTLFPDSFFDVSAILNVDAATWTLKREVFVDGVSKEIFLDTMTGRGIGVYRFFIRRSGWSEDRIDITILDSSNVVQSETMTINVATECNLFNVSWLNYLGGFDYWNFTARKTFFVGVEESRTMEKNLYVDFPKSYGEWGDTVQKQTKRKSRNVIRVESQNLSLEELEAIKWILSSPLVVFYQTSETTEWENVGTSTFARRRFQAININTDRRILIVEPSTTQIRKEQQDLFSIGFTASYTDELPAQSL